MIKFIYCLVFAVFSLAICTDYTFDAKETAVELKDALTKSYTFPACEDSICIAGTTFTFDLSEMDVSYFQLLSSVDEPDSYTFDATITFTDGNTTSCDGSTSVTEFTDQFKITFNIDYHEPCLMLNRHFTTLMTLTDVEDSKNWSILLFMNTNGIDTPTYETGLPPYVTLADGCQLDSDFSVYYAGDTMITFVSYCNYTIDFQGFIDEVGSNLPGGKANMIEGSYTDFSAFDYTRGEIDLGTKFEGLYYISYSVATGKYTLDTESPYLFGLTETQAKIAGSIIGVLGFIANIYCWYRCCCRKKRARPPMMPNQMMMAPGYGQPAPSFNPQQQYGMQRPY